ncbi:phosphoglycerate mutase, partial [Candidatus Parcubacteria bacterium]|nr:phosphoglycerate mutase [Candidatus Parcubacteria bacterium]
SFGEDGNFLAKKEFIEKIDKEISALLGLKNTILVLTGDHPTSCLRKSHFFGPNPLLVFGAEKDKVEKFSETECEKGKLGKIPQLRLLNKILKLASRID